MTCPSAPAVSVIMAAYNGAGTIRASIDSVLAQTCTDLELIVADDGSTDGTLDILDGVDDPRLRVLRNPRNLGVVESRNRCFAEATGEFVALLDHDDLSAPTRLARQVAYLRANPGTVLVGTAARALENGRLRRMTHPDVTTPGLIAWLLLIANPLVCSSVMFRAAAARRLGAFMRADYTYADDYDFYHRMATLGAVARLDAPLTIYRLHDNNAYKRHEQVMEGNAVRVLAPAYSTLFGATAEESALMVVQHLSAAKPVADADALRKLCRIFDTLNRSVLENPATDDATRQALPPHAAVLWRRMLRSTSSSGRVSLADMRASRPAGVRAQPVDVSRLVAERLPWREGTRALVRRARSPDRTECKPGALFGIPYLPHPPAREEAPRLFVVVDTEAEFDWSKPFARELTSVSAMDDVGRGQAIFDAYGLRPIYVIDYPVASQPRGFGGLRAIMERGGCEIGAHLHPWTTPPFEEEVCARNSYPGNLEPQLEERKLATLMEAIRGSFGMSPVFYKAGRYGFGPATPAALAQHGIRVDLSILPGADLSRKGGPDFRQLQPVPYRIGGTDILSLPMTRSNVGPFAALGSAGRAFHELPGAAVLRIPSVLARLGLAETIVLTPEGVTAEEQIRLVRVMLNRGTRLFVLHYHSPSLSPGHTPYVRDGAEAEILIDRLRQVCRYFFEELGGLPGYPRDLLRMLPQTG